VIFGSAGGGYGLLLEQNDIFQKSGYRRVSPFLISNMLPDAASGHVSIMLGACGPNMAVVSACESARIGRFLADEAVSLPTALAQVGFAGVVGTLWRVPDTAAGLLVSAFYTAWRQERHEPAEALRRAQAQCREA
jgi:hypothetical protein